MSNKALPSGELAAAADAMSSALASTAVFADAESRQHERESTRGDGGDTLPFGNIMHRYNYQAGGDHDASNHFAGAWPDYPGQSPVDEAADSGEIAAAAWSTKTFLARDRTAPKVVSFDPSDGSNDVDAATDITVTFSEEIQAGRGSIEIRVGSSRGAVVESFDVASSSNLTFDGSTLTIDPTSDLDAGTHYYVTFARGTVVDLSGNKYTGTKAYDFTTGTVDTTAPVVSVFSPADGSGNVAVGSNITLTFSEAIQAGSGSIEIREGSATGALIESFDVATSGNLSFSGSTLTIDPSSNLDLATHYYVTIGSGAVLDLAGNSYAGTTDYDFTTGFAPAEWDTVSGYGLLDIDAMLELATGISIADAALYGDGYGSWDWGLNDVQAPDAWQAGYTGEGIVVAVIDSGVLYTHSDLAGNIWTNSGEIAGDGIDNDGNGYVDDIYGYDFVNYDGYALDDNGHGTHVAGRRNRRGLRRHHHAGQGAQLFGQRLLHGGRQRHRLRRR